MINFQVFNSGGDINNFTKIKNYDGFLFDMEVSLFWSKQKEIKHITKGIYGKYWNWNDYNNLKIKRKDKQFIKDIEYYKELMDMRMQLRFLLLDLLKSGLIVKY